MDKKILKKAYDLGFTYEQEHGNCAQCTFAAVQDAFGEPNDDVFKAAEGFGAGSGRMGTGNCGAYSGGILAISLKFGRTRQDFEAGKSSGPIPSQELNRELHNKFVAEYGCVICNDIRTKLFGRTFNLWDPKEREEFEKAGAHDVPPYHCPTVVGKAAQWTAEILLKAEKSKK